MALSTTHTPLSGLIKKLLLSIDSYNSADLTLETAGDTTVDTLGERARVCINFALHKIYSLIKDSKYLENFPVTTLASTTSQDYIDLDPEAFLDDIESITDTTNDYKLIKKSWGWYRRHAPDPSAATGTPIYYIRRGSRVYLTPRPTSAITYTVDFKKLVGDLKLNGDLPLIPTQYDIWIISEAKFEWFVMEDPSSVPQVIVEGRNDTRQAALESIMTSYDQIRQAGSNTESEPFGMMPWSSPAS